jgi:hypothetical protein
MRLPSFISENTVHKSDHLSSVYRLKSLHLSGRGKNQEKCKDATGALEKTNP